MALSCSRCGRDYDVTLFEFGHKVTCVCGKVLTLEEGHRLRLDEQRKPTSAREPRPKKPEGDSCLGM